MAPNVKDFLQVALLCYLVTTSIGGSIDFQKAFATLQKEVEDLKQQSQEQINSLVTELNELRQQSKQEINILHQRLEQIEAKGQLYRGSLHTSQPRGLKSFSHFRYC